MHTILHSQQCSPSTQWQWRRLKRPGRGAPCQLGVGAGLGVQASSCTSSVSYNTLTEQKTLPPVTAYVTAGLRWQHFGGLTSCFAAGQ